MKTAQLVIGIVSIVLCCFILFQSCAVGLGNVLEENGETSGSAGFFLACCMLVAGIIALASRNKENKKGNFAAAGFYTFGAVIGFANYGSYSDLAFWSVISFAFGVVMIAAANQRS